LRDDSGSFTLACCVAQLYAVTILEPFHCFSRKNKFPDGEVTMILLVAPFTVTDPTSVQFVVVKSEFFCNVQLAVDESQ
jgi:hypothetical protein